MKSVRIILVLACGVFMFGCKVTRYLDYHADHVDFYGYALEPVLESTPTAEAININGILVHESYPIIFRFFLEADLEKRPKRLEVYEIELESVQSGLRIDVEPKSTERVNRPTRLSHSQESLTMHFVLDRFEQKELPFEDYKLRCRVRIYEESGEVLEEALEFDLRSSVVTGVR